MIEYIREEQNQSPRQEKKEPLTHQQNQIKVTKEVKGLELEEILSLLERMFISKEFKSKQQQFFQQNRTKLHKKGDIKQYQHEHYEIFQQYQITLEKYIENEIKRNVSNFSFSELITTLLQYNNKNCEDDLIDDNFLELMATLTQFDAFMELAEQYALCFADKEQSGTLGLKGKNLNIKQ